jgi:cytochrome c553
VVLPLGEPAPEDDLRRRKGEIAIAVAILGCLGVLTAISVAQAPGPAESEVGEPAAVADSGGGADGAPGAADDVAALAAPILARSCASCHTIDDDPDGGETGPPLRREGFAERYRESFFRLKVSDPAALWEDTGMVYKPKRRKPTDEQLEILVRYFFPERE